jgi:hypothetical protein
LRDPGARQRRGNGIPAEQLPQLFGKDQRLLAAVETEGTGHGLFIAKSLVDAHGGRVRGKAHPTMARPSSSHCRLEIKKFTMKCRRLRAPAWMLSSISCHSPDATFTEQDLGVPDDHTRRDPRGRERTPNTQDKAQNIGGTLAPRSLNEAQPAGGAVSFAVPRRFSAAHSHAKGFDTSALFGRNWLERLHVACVRRGRRLIPDEMLIQGFVQTATNPHVEGLFRRTRWRTTRKKKPKVL